MMKEKFMLICVIGSIVVGCFLCCKEQNVKERWYGRKYITVGGKNNGMYS